jgi:hypothetical protein
MDRSVDREVRVPEAIVNVENVMPVTMEEVVSRLTAALVKVVSNKGAPGPDGQTVEVLRQQWPIAGPRLAASLDDGIYRPGAIRRANIPKAGGGVRGLVIPNVIDSTVAAAILDRLLHHASYRMRSHRARLATLRASLNHPAEAGEFSRSHLGNSHDR